MVVLVLFSPFPLIYPIVFSCFCHAHTHTYASSCPMVLTTTVQQIPPTCTAMGGVWARALPFPSSLLLPHPPPPLPAQPAHGHVPPQPCCQTTLTTARWAPPWCLHHESPAGRLVHSSDTGDHLFTRLTCRYHLKSSVCFFYSLEVKGSQ